MKETVITCNQITTACEAFAGVSKEHKSDFKKVYKSAEDAGKDASNVLKDFKVP